VPPGVEHALYEDVDGPSFPELDVQGTTT
jgi:hypothetical protein